MVVILPPDAPRRPSLAARKRGPTKASRWRLVAALAFLMGSGVAAVNAYLPLYLVEVGGASQALAAAVVATIGLVGIFSPLAWGWASERMPTFSLPLLMLGGGAVVAIGSSWPSSGWDCGSPGRRPSCSAPPPSLERGRQPGRHHRVGHGLAGRATGLLTFGFYIGFVGSPVLFGLLVDATGSYTLAWSLIGLGFAATVAVILGWRRSAAHAAVPASRTGLEA